MTDDPFFTLGRDSNWNACIGRQSDAENYVDGYFEAAVELVDIIFEKKLFGKRDTLVLPILYNARHGLELLLKLVANELKGISIYNGPIHLNHDIALQFEALKRAKIPDERIRLLLNRLQPFVASLARIDGDGQQLRYAADRDGNPSLEEHSVVSLQVIAKGLFKLQKIAGDVQARIYGLKRERRYGFHTPELSRSDLVEVSKLLPAKERWTSPEFTRSKTLIQNRYELSGRKFSDALDAIKRNRETLANLGCESVLLHLAERDIQWLIEKHIALNPPCGKSSFVIDMESLHQAVLHDLNNGSPSLAIKKEVVSKLSTVEIADLYVIFYTGRDGNYPEDYEAHVAEKIGYFEKTSEGQEYLMHVFCKTNFVESVVAGIEILGASGLAAKLRENYLD